MSLSQMTNALRGTGPLELAIRRDGERTTVTLFAEDER
jgi:hypothetical protein